MIPGGTPESRDRRHPMSAQAREKAAVDRGLSRSTLNPRVWWCGACLNSVDVEHVPGSEDCQTAAFERAWSQADE